MTLSISTGNREREIGKTPVDLQPEGAVLLISCYELGHQPLNLAFPLAYLRQAGYAPVVVDTAVDQLDDASIDRARLVGISVPMHTALRLGEAIARRVRERNPTITLVFYGLYAWLNRDYLLREQADFVIGGEYEQPLLELAQSLEAGRPPSSGSLDSRQPSLGRVNFPMPERESLPAPRNYARLMMGGLAIPAGYTETTRGCHHTCLHCPVVPVYHGRFFAIPRNVVLEDIRRQVGQGVGHITFGDPDFLNGPTHALRICREMHAEFPSLTFDMTTRIEHILQHRELFPEFAELGCVFAISAVESVSESVLEHIEKGHTRQDVVEALGVLESAGIAMRPSLLPFTPWTTLDDYLELLDFVAEHDLVSNIDPVHFSIRLLVPPDSELLKRPETSEWLGPLDETAYTYHWTHPDPRVDDLQRQVAALVERANAEEQDDVLTFSEIRALAYRMAGREQPPRLVANDERRRPPKLSESWFC